MASLALPPNYSLVLLTSLFTPLVNTYHIIEVGRTRGLAHIEYPNAYATAQEASESKAAYIFNCAQRAHSNYIEHQTPFLVCLLIAGLKAPLASALMGTAWCVARCMYLRGYISPDEKNVKGKGRFNGAWHYWPMLGLLGTALWSAVSGIDIQSIW